MTLRGRIRRHAPWLEPWYDWGTTNAFRLDAQESDFSDESEAEVRHFEVQWLGLHFAIQIGRTPPRVPETEVALRKRMKGMTPYGPNHPDYPNRPRDWNAQGWQVRRNGSLALGIGSTWAHAEPGSPRAAGDIIAYTPVPTEVRRG